MSHLPMRIDYDDHKDWVTTQLRASCNVEHSLFNDWWSGHLNFQIEHQSVTVVSFLCYSSEKFQSMCTSDRGTDYSTKPVI